ncbi:DUF4180 domain-containing protein [Pseudonocardia sp. NPDC046786]|uniref:DUF4180 domain-containing protein n=1 Tax=Pseudonocardia sp. NPDC046786 TaxID=3155471 RepID=UPI0033F0B762
MTRVLTLPADGPVIASEADAIDVLGDAFGQQAELVEIPVQRLAPEFFRLRSGLAGAITQKFAQYGVRLSVVGDISRWTAEPGPVADWVREANEGAGTLRFTG